MQKGGSHMDLNEIYQEDYYDLGFNNNLFNTPKQDSNSQSLSFKNNPVRENQMFNSPINKTLAVGYLTPVAPYPSLGFTPFTPFDKGAERQNFDLQGNIYQALNFDPPVCQNNYSYQIGERTAIKRKREQQVFKTPANKSKRVEAKSAAKRTERKRKEVEMTDYVKTNEQRSHRGLRNLASSVKEVATKLGVATSKQIAQTLIKDLQLQKSTTSKEHQNIKRRVYDALKVLVSADVLIKDKKSLIARPVAPDSTSLKGYRDQLKQKIQAAKKSIQSKSHKALTINNKWVVREQLLQHNRKNFEISENKIFFPFLAITLNKNNLVYINLSKDKNLLSVGFKQSKLRIMGDIDIVLEMRILEEKGKEKPNRAEQPHREPEVDQGGELKISPKKKVKSLQNM